MVDDLAIELRVVPSIVPFAFGSTYLEAVTRPIPRALWASKPLASDTQLMTVIWPQLAIAQVGFAFSIFGEPYLNLGILGVIPFCLGFGVAWKTLYVSLRRHPSNRFVITVYALSWPFLLVYVRG